MVDKLERKIIELQSEIEEIKKKVLVDLTGKTFKQWASEQKSNP